MEDREDRARKDAIQREQVVSLFGKLDAANEEILHLKAEIERLKRTRKIEVGTETEGNDGGDMAHV